MASASEENRFAPPLAHVEDVVQAGSGTLAGRGSRLVATLIDAVCQGAVFALLVLLTPLTWTPPDRDHVFATLLVNGAVGFVIFLVLQGFLLATRGQTVGKTLLKLRIVRSDGSPASLARLVGLRYLPTMVITLLPVLGGLYALIDSLLIFRESRRCLHDTIADTIVVKA
jgi:uncharacterized RDD family membrane protein YckC